MDISNKTEKLLTLLENGEQVVIERHCTNNSKGEYSLRIRCYPCEGDDFVLIGKEGIEVLKQVLNYAELEE